MRYLRKILSLLLALLLSAALSACSLHSVAMFVMVDVFGGDPDAAEYRLDPSSFVVFTKYGGTEDIYIPVDQVDEYQSRYADCMGSWYADQLDREGRRVYNAYLYAMEHYYTGFSLYFSEKAPDIQHIRNMVALDSPFLEQNTRQEGEYRKNWDPTRYGTRVYFHADSFTKPRWDLKMQALEACRKIVEEIPSKYNTQEEKMLYLYHYICDQITYTQYETDSGQNYLYDAVCNGKTNCDGYSNMLLLLYNLIGVEACEVMGNEVQLSEDATKEEKQKNVGHTWVAAKLGDQYYHFDPTYEDTTTEFLTERIIYFGVSDEMVSNKYMDYDDMRPKCDDTSRDFSFTQLTVDNIKNEKQIKSIAKLTDKRTKNKQYTTYVLVNDTINGETMDKMLESYIKKVDYVKRVHVSSIVVMGKSILKVKTEPR